MLIIIECIHRVTDSLGSITDDAVFDTGNIDCGFNKVTCRINSILSVTLFRLPDGSIILDDVMIFLMIWIYTDNMTVYLELHHLIM